MFDAVSSYVLYVDNTCYGGIGRTYTISDVGGAMQGARKLDDNTFAFIFEGIEYDLDGAYIWCIIEDGHYSVTSQKNRISVGNENMPPEIVSIPSDLTVEQGDLAEIRCVAKTTDGSELSLVGNRVTLCSNGRHWFWC